MPDVAPPSRTTAYGIDPAQVYDVRVPATEVADSHGHDRRRRPRRVLEGRVGPRPRGAAGPGLRRRGSPRRGGRVPTDRYARGRLAGDVRRRLGGGRRRARGPGPARPLRPRRPLGRRTPRRPRGDPPRGEGAGRCRRPGRLRRPRARPGTSASATERRRRFMGDADAAAWTAADPAAHPVAHPAGARPRRGRRHVSRAEVAERFLERQGPTAGHELLRLPEVGHMELIDPAAARLPGGPRCGGPVGRVVGSRHVRAHLVRRAAAHRDGQGRHRQDDRRRGDGHRARVGRSPGAARRGRGTPGHQPDLRRAAAGHRRSPDRRSVGRRRGRGALGRRQGRPHRVPPDLLQARPGGRGARAVRRDRLRHDHRPRRARRPAHRQGLRGEPAPRRAATTSATTSHPGLRRDRARRPADRPRRSGSSRSTRRSPTWPRSARSAPRPTRSPRCSRRRRPPSTS